MKKQILLAVITVVLFVLQLTADGTRQKTAVGGYGELHYNHKNVDNKDPLNTLDFHRFVVFFSHTWAEKWTFKAEVELEHNFVKNGQGELELEQAFIQYSGSDWFNFQIGVLLPSVGLINERHEPPLFLSVERPDYAKYIIPTTWFGNGLAFFGYVQGFEYRITVMEGFNGDGFSLESGIRGGRQKGYKASFDSPLYNIRLDYTGISGLRLGGSYSHNRANMKEDLPIPIHLTEFHLQYSGNRFFTIFEIGNVGYNRGDLQTSFGYYIDLAYDIGPWLKSPMTIYPWLRWTEYNTASSVRGEVDNSAFKVSKWLTGITIKPLPEVVFKIEAGTESRGEEPVKTFVFNIGAGYMF